jgi:hypothetical protein
MLGLISTASTGRAAAAAAIGRQAGNAAGEPGAVDDAGVRGVAEQHLVARIDDGEHDLEDRRGAAAGHDDLALGVVAAAGALGQEVADRRAQIAIAGEGQPAVGLRRLEAPDRLGDRLGRERQVGVEVLQPEHVAPGVGRVRQPVDAEAADVLQPLRPLEGYTV